MYVAARFFGLELGKGVLSPYFLCNFKAGLSAAMRAVFCVLRAGHGDGTCRVGEWTCAGPKDEPNRTFLLRNEFPSRFDCEETISTSHIVFFSCNWF